jgi:hypothetical protein
MTATVTPLREKQLIRAGDRVCDALEILAKAFLAHTDDPDSRAEIRTRVDGIKWQWRQLAYGAQAEDGEAA